MTDNRFFLVRSRRPGRVRRSPTSKIQHPTSVIAVAVLLAGCHSKPSTKACAEMVAQDFRPIAAVRDQRFLGKVQEATATCRGEDKATWSLNTPWVDWANYRGAG